MSNIQKVFLNCVCTTGKDCKPFDKEMPKIAMEQGMMYLRAHEKVVLLVVMIARGVTVKKMKMKR
jgi:hypothetical protein